MWVMMNINAIFSLPCLTLLIIISRLLPYCYSPSHHDIPNKPQKNIDLRSLFSYQAWMDPNNCLCLLRGSFIGDKNIWRYFPHGTTLLMVKIGSTHTTLFQDLTNNVICDIEITMTMTFNSCFKNLLGFLYVLICERLEIVGNLTDVERFSF